VEGEGLTTTTGGDGGEIVTATSIDELRDYAEADEPLVIQIQGALDGHVAIASNKTLIGLGPAVTLSGGLEIDGQSNVIVKNLSVVDGEPDGITINSSHHVWIDHVAIVDAADGNLDITDQSDFVTVSWSKFSYSSTSGDHRYSNLIGAGDEVEGDRGKLRTTYHHNWWAQNVHERMPRVRFGKVHVLNNLYTASGNNYCVRVGVEADILLEQNYFDGVSSPIDDDAAGHLKDVGNVFDDTSGSTWSDDTSFTPPYAYSANAVETLPQLIQQNAGPR
jgi:pectate lyase